MEYAAQSREHTTTRRQEENLAQTRACATGNTPSLCTINTSHTRVGEHTAAKAAAHRAYLYVLITLLYTHSHKYVFAHRGYTHKTTCHPSFRRLSLQYCVCSANDIEHDPRQACDDPMHAPSVQNSTQQRNSVWGRSATFTNFPVMAILARIPTSIQY